MLEIPAFYVKDKQAFRKKEGTMAIIGNAVDVAKKLSKKAKLIHIIDLDALQGMSVNFDIYDKLTYLVNIEVETDPRPEIVSKLLKIKSRAVVRLPADLETFEKEKRLLVGKITGEYNGKTDSVHDLIIENAGDKSIEKFPEKRIIIYEKDFEKLREKKKIWGKINFI